ncbi:hypothetical protein [Candidatus Finniella inopinata]|uniref:Uncharacterized protein n=1 Tax=Candidatus Finniella inopinata TaxID=1696036 RepID=A0A4Q7DKD1_9PROT|nr:hypothetical protein [Candidatus Finniella inopinata]RZI46655.1 hypothetical protein EQU50_03465 [Candidatus Finniella inopinata]
MTLPSQHPYPFLCVDDDEPAFEVLLSKNLKKLFGLDQKEMDMFMTDTGLFPMCFMGIGDVFAESEEEGN